MLKLQPLRAPGGPRQVASCLQDGADLSLQSPAAGNDAEAGGGGSPPGHTAAAGRRRAPAVVVGV